MSELNPMQKNCFLFIGQRGILVVKTLQFTVHKCDINHIVYAVGTLLFP